MAYKKDFEQLLSDVDVVLGSDLRKDQRRYWLTRALENHGVRVPEDVSITGFDDYIYGPDTRPITTYAVDQQRMAQVTVRRLQNRIREGMEGPLRTSVGGWFVERDSVMDLHTGKRCGRMEKD